MPLVKFLGKKDIMFGISFSVSKLIEINLFSCSFIIYPFDFYSEDYDKLHKV